jgi:hypothetical protein
MRCIFYSHNEGLIVNIHQLHAELGEHIVAHGDLDGKSLLALRTFLADGIPEGLERLRSKTGRIEEVEEALIHGCIIDDVAKVYLEHSAVENNGCHIPKPFWSSSKKHAAGKVTERTAFLIELEDNIREAHWLERLLFEYRLALNIRHSPDIRAADLAVAPNVIQQVCEALFAAAKEAEADAT